MSGRGRNKLHDLMTRVVSGLAAGLCAVVLPSPLFAHENNEVSSGPNLDEETSSPETRS